MLLDHIRGQGPPRGHPTNNDILPISSDSLHVLRAAEPFVRVHGIVLRGRELDVGSVAIADVDNTYLERITDPRTCRMLRVEGSEQEPAAVEVNEDCELGRNGDMAGAVGPG